MEIWKAWPPKLGCHGDVSFEVLRHNVFKFFPEKCKKNSLKLVVIACTVLKLLFKSKFRGASNYIAIGGS